VADTLTFRILAPSREVWSGEADAVTLTAFEGAIGVLPGHAPLLAQLRTGEASVRTGGEVHWFALSDGFVEVADDVVTALVRSGESAEEIDVERAQRRLAELQQQVEDMEPSDRARDAALASIEKQALRIQVAERRG